MWRKNQIGIISSKAHQTNFTGKTTELYVCNESFFFRLLGDVSFEIELFVAFVGTNI